MELVTINIKAIRRIIFSIILFAGIIAFLECSDKSAGSDFNSPGSIAPVISFKKTSPLINIPSIVKIVRVTVENSTYSKTVYADYDDNQAEIADIPEGTYTLTVDGLDKDSVVLFSGSVNVNILANVISEPYLEVKQVKPIILVFVSPGDGEIVGSKNITLSGMVMTTGSLTSFKIDNNEVSVNADQWSKSVTLNDGNNSFAFRAESQDRDILIDTLNVSYSSTVIDTIGPLLQIVIPDDGDTVSVRNITVSGTVNDPSGIDAVQVNGETATLNGSSWDHSVTLVNNITIIRIMTTDNSAQHNTTKDSVTVYFDSTYVDTKPPQIIIDDPSDGAVVSINTVVVRGTAYDVSGIADVKVNSIDAEIDNTTWFATVPLQIDSNTIIVEVWDASNNSNKFIDSITVIFDELLVDTIPPIIEIKSPSNNTVVSNPDSVEISGSASDESGIKSITVNNTDASYNTSDQTWRAFINLTEAGDNPIKAVAEDSKGNKDSTSINIVYDSTSSDSINPAIELDSPNENDTVGITPAEITVIATDKNGIDWVKIQNITAEKLQTNKYRAPVPMSIGKNDIVVTAMDKSANQNQGEQTFTIYYDPTVDDVTPPTITLNSPVNNTIVFSTSQLVKVEAEDDKSGIACVTIKGDTAALVSGLYQYDVTLTEGQNTIEVNAWDNSVNKNKKTENYTLILDSPPQPVTLNSPSEVTFSSVKLSWSQNTETDFAAYKVFYSQTPGVNDTSELDTIITNKIITYHTITNLSPHTKYYAKVYVYDNYSSAASNEVDTVTANRKPVFAVIDTQKINEAQQAVFTVSATDPDGDSVSYTMPTALQPPELSTANFNISTGEFTWTTDYDLAGIYTAKFVAVDNASSPLSDTLAVVIQVINVNRPPYFVYDTVTLVDTAVITVEHRDTVRAVDPDGETVTFSLVASHFPSGMSIISDSIITWTPAEKIFSDAWILVDDGNSGLDTLKKSVVMPVHVELVGSYNPGYTTYSFALNGDYAYLLHRTNGLTVADISDLSSPSYVSSVSWTGNYNYEMVISGSYGFVADGTNGLSVLDLSNPASPFLAYNRWSGGLWSIDAQGNYAYVGNGGSWKLQIYDMSNPADTAILAGECSVDKFYPVGIELLNDYAYSTSTDSGLYIIDVSNVSSPSISGRYNTPGAAYDVEIVNNHAFIADITGLFIINVSDPAAPSYVADFATPANANCIEILNNYAFIGNGGEGSVYIFDISDPSSPQFLGANSSSMVQVTNISIRDEYLYVISTTNGFEIFKINNL